jgi:hypothetical protein
MLRARRAAAGQRLTRADACSCRAFHPLPLPVVCAHP